MFAIALVEGKRAIVDATRDVVVSLLEGARDGGGVFVLSWGSRRIPFDARKRDEDGVRPDGWVGHMHYSVSAIGRPHVQGSWSEPPYDFEDRDEEEQACLLATEALLVYGDHYNGLDFQDGYISAGFSWNGEAKRYILTDFGYHPTDVRWP